MFSVVLDTCVLYPAYLRDTLLRLAAAELYRPLWSTAILDELVTNLRGKAGDDRAQRVRTNMSTSFPDAHVAGYDALIPSMTNDPKDRHVLAAAVRSTASAIVTFNLGDFPPEAVDPYDIEVLHPDAFLLNQLDLAPGAALQVLRRQVAGYREPTMDLFALAGALERCGCPDTADELRLLAEGNRA
jgi:predicted nucleic acid-binding protein